MTVDTRRYMLMSLRILGLAAFCLAAIVAMIGFLGVVIPCAAHAPNALSAGLALFAGAFVLVLGVTMMIVPPRCLAP